MSRFLVLAVLLVSCAPAPSTPVAGGETPATTTTATTGEIATTTTPPQFETTPCTETPSMDFSLLCQAYALIDETHVDPVDPEALAAAAVLGVEQVEPSPSEQPDRPFRCVLPHTSFEDLCHAMAEQDTLGAFELGPLVEGAVQGMFRFGLDPFSSYVPPDLADRLDALGSGFVPSLGLVVGAVDDADAACGPISATCRLRVLAVFDFTAAERGGLVPGDAIVAVDGSSLEGLSPTEAIAALFGEPGTSMQLQVERASGRVTKSLVHEDLRLEPVEFDMLAPGIAYLRLNEFSQLSAQLTGRVLEADEVRGGRGLILDLRGNPGGLLLAAQAVASQFLQEGEVMVEYFRSGIVPVPVLDGGLAPDLPLVVLVDRGSASASEVVAAVLKERGRATVLGSRTFGKNLVQEIHRARNGGEFRVSVARWATPDGVDVGINGLEPDIVIEVPPDTQGDPVLQAALDLLGD